MAGAYFINCHDKTANVPAICEQYSGAGKIAIWTEAVPAFDINKFAEAVATPRTINGYTYYAYDENGNKITKVITAIKNVTSNQTAVTKIQKYMKNGRIVIEKDGKRFTTTGVQIR